MRGVRSAIAHQAIDRPGSRAGTGLCPGSGRVTSSATPGRTGLGLASFWCRFARSGRSVGSRSGRAAGTGTAGRGFGCRCGGGLAGRFFGWQPSATIYPKTNRYRLVFFRPFPPVLARVRGLASRAPPLQTLRFCTRQRLSVRRFLWWPRERARDLIHKNQ